MRRREVRGQRLDSPAGHDDGVGRQRRAAVQPGVRGEDRSSQQEEVEQWLAQQSHRGVLEGSLSTAECRNMSAMRPRRLTALMAVLALSLFGAPARSARAEAPKLGKPLWTVDLRKQDGSQDWLGTGPYDAPRMITFVSRDELVVARHKEGVAKPSAAHACSLDASSGRIIGQADWTTYRGWVFATDAGRLLVNTDTGAALYASGLKEIVARSERSVRWASPNGRVMGAWFAQDEPRHGVTEFLDSKTLEPLGIRFLDQNVESIAGDRISFRGSGSVSVDSPAGRVGTFRTNCDARPDFVADDLLVASGCRTFFVVRGDGQLLFSGDSPEDELFSSASRDGRRFVLSRSSYAVSHRSPLRRQVFTVFDVEGKAAIARLEVPAAPQGLDDSHAGSALSPDGTLLAILSGGEVSLYRLP